MADETVTLSSAWRQAEHARDQALGCNAQAPDYQDIVTRALNLYKRCSTLADQLSLFSRNEDIEEVASRDLGFLQISHRLGELTERSYGGDRKSTLILARSHYQAFLENLELYHLLSKIETVLLDDFRAEPSSFSVSSSSDPAVRRQTKIARFLTDKELKQKLKVNLADSFIG